MITEITPAWAFNRYQEILERLPQPTRAGTSRPICDLRDVTDQFDVFVFDAFGVLNIGETPIDGAAARINELRGHGKQIFLLSNSASQPSDDIRKKYAEMGYDFALSEVITSRDVMIPDLRAYDSKMIWGVVAPPDTKCDDLPCHTVWLDAENISNVDGIIFLKISEWSDAQHQNLIHELAVRPMPVLIGNPDLVGPREDSFSRQPGFYGHDIWDHTGVVPAFFGKPYANAFELVRERLGSGVSEKRVLMVGDTLHTDILGAVAAGFSAALVTQHGVLRGLDVAACIEASGIKPDLILPSI